MSGPRPDSLAPRAVERLGRAARAARALSDTLWEALQDELSHPEDPSEQGGRVNAARVVELSERLADVSATVALLASVEVPDGVADPSEDVSGVADPTPTFSRSPTQPSPVEPVHPRSEPPGQPESPEAPPAQSSHAVLVDELALAPPESESPPSPAPAPSEIAIRDERGEEERRALGLAPERQRERSPDPWVAVIARRLEGYQRDRTPFAVLAVELADVERLRHAELPGEMARLTGLVESALAGQLGPADSLTRAAPGRYWLLAAQTDSEGARALAERLARAVRGAVSHRGAPLELAVGVAACPADATRAGALAAHAEIALYAARATGRPMAP